MRSEPDLGYPVGELASKWRELHWAVDNSSAGNTAYAVINEERNSKCEIQRLIKVQVVQILCKTPRHSENFMKLPLLPGNFTGTGSRVINKKVGRLKYDTGETSGAQKKVQVGAQRFAYNMLSSADTGLWLTRFVWLVTSTFSQCQCRHVFFF